MRSGTYLLPSKKASQPPLITEAATRGTSGIREEVKPMTKQPGIQQVGILLAPTVVFHDTFFSPPHTGVAANDDDEVPSRQSHGPN